jgi:predicted outer membrane repeat protein
MNTVLKMYQFQAQASILQTAWRWQYLAVLLLTLGILFAACPAYCTDYYVAPDGNDDNDGSIDYPFKTITEANSVVVAGDTIYLRGGTHDYSSTVYLTKNGSDGNCITLQAYQDEVVILDFNEQPRINNYRGVTLSGNYWHLEGFIIQKAADNGLYITGSNNIAEQLVTRYNGDSGLQLGGSGSNNLVADCDSYLNFDPANDGENADGFAVKSKDIGPGNVFRRCRSWNNSDDGYDFYYAGDTSGNGVRLEDCWAFRNGEDLWELGDDFRGDGNGFKLGESGGPHVLVRCVAYDHWHNGFDVNGNTGGVTVYNCTGVANYSTGTGKNFYFDEHNDIHVLRNNLSYDGSENIYDEIDDTNNSWNYYDDYGWTVTAADFVSLDPNFDPIVDPNDYNNVDSNGIDGPRGPNGELPKPDFLRLARGSWLIDIGIDVNEPFEGYAPDLGAFEYSGIVIFVDRDAGGANDGSNWENAYTSLQDALDDAQPADRIWVAEGTYKPNANSAVPNGNGDRTATFQLKNHVAVYGGYAGFGEPDPNARDVDLYETILSGDIGTPDVNTDNSYHVVTGSGTDANAILDGFTVTAGNANGSTDPNNHGGGMYNYAGSPTLTNCIFSGNISSSSGGGVFNSTSSPTLTNCTFVGNSTPDRGGGMRNNSSSPTLINCTFSGNSAGSNGGGMHNYYSAPTIIGCTFSKNSSWHAKGGGIANYSSNSIVTNCTFSGNTAESAGGGIYTEGNSSLMVTNCIFVGNSTNTNGGGINTGGSSSWTVTNCVFTGNSATDNGGGTYSSGGSPTLTNCTFIGNDANNGGGMYNYSSNPTLTNCILRGNTAGTDGNEIALESSSTIDVNYCDVEGGQAAIYNDGTSTINWGTNIDADPNFVRDPCDGGDGWGVGDNDDYGDLHLLPDSPCIDAGDSNAVPAGITTDIDGDPRFVDDPCTADTGSGSPPIVDMGSDELLRVSETVGQGQTVTVNPGGGSGDPTEDALVVFENQSTSTANVTVTQMASDLHAEQGAFVVMGTTLIIETSLADGEFLMTVAIPFTAADLDGRDWKLLDLKYWDGSTWVTAGTGPRDVNTPPAPTLGQLKAKGLGAYGVYWDSTDGKGFVWANVNHSTDFTAALLPGDFEPDSDVDFVDFAKFAPNWLDTGCGLCDDADLTGDGNVDFYDLEAFADNWLAGK